MKTLTLTVEAKTQFDLEIAVEDALRGIKTGCSSGLGGIDDWEYVFESSGEFEEIETEEA